jgi:hypothetical protein
MRNESVRQDIRRQNRPPTEQPSQANNGQLATEFFEGE